MCVPVCATPDESYARVSLAIKLSCYLNKHSHCAGSPSGALIGQANWPLSRSRAAYLFVRLPAARCLGFLFSLSPSRFVQPQVSSDRHRVPVPTSVNCAGVASAVRNANGKIMAKNERRKTTTTIERFSMASQRNDKANQLRAHLLCSTWSSSLSSSMAK